MICRSSKGSSSFAPNVSCNLSEAGTSPANLCLLFAWLAEIAKPGNVWEFFMQRLSYQSDQFPDRHLFFLERFVRMKVGTRSESKRIVGSQNIIENGVVKDS